MSILVFGSINLDLVSRTAQLPCPGETVIGKGFEMVPGGKGANQAVAIARLDQFVQMVGRVGGDAFGQMLLRELEASGVGCENVWVDATTSSGVAAIAVDDQGENHIIVTPGANGRMDQTDVARLKPLLSEAKVLLLQLETPLPTVLLAAQAAHQAGVTVILDPAPAPPNLPTALYEAIDILTPNQTEAGQMVGFAVDTVESATRASEVLRRRGARTTIVKLGQQGALCSSPEETFHLPAFVVQAIDTVAAGDAFNGGLAAGLATGLSLRQAVTQASAVAALSVSQRGAQPSMPTRSQVAAFLEQA